MKFWLILLVLVIIYSCSQSDTKVIDKKRPPGKVSMEDLQGHWNCIESVTDFTRIGMPTRAEITTSYDTVVGDLTQLVIQVDSLYKFEYPCRMDVATTFRLESDLIYWSDNASSATSIKLFNDILIIVQDGGTRNVTVTEKFVRDTLDEKILTVLKTRGINPDCLIGRMKMVTEAETEDRPMKLPPPPVNMPQNINLNSEAARKIREEGTIILTIDGKPTLFTTIGV